MPMMLPNGKTCVNCERFEKCSYMFGTLASRTDCYYNPIMWEFNSKSPKSLSS